MPEPIQTPSAVPPAAPAPAAPVVQAAPTPAAPTPPAPAPATSPAAAAAPAAVTAPAAPEPPVAAAAPTTPATPTVAPTAAELAPDDSDDHESRVVTMRRADLGKMVRDQKDAALLKEAKTLGYETTAAMLDAAKKARLAAPEPPAPPPPAVPTPPVLQAAASPPAPAPGDDIERERKARIAAERKVARLASERDADHAERELERIASRVGIEDTDYALRCYTRECEGKSADELAKMNEQSFFKDLLVKRPYLGRAESRPATTGPGAAGAPASAPSPGNVAAAAGAAAVFDARKATQAQIDARLAQLKIDTHERGVVGTPQKEE